MLSKGSEAPGDLRPADRLCRLFEARVSAAICGHVTPHRALPTQQTGVSSFHGPGGRDHCGGGVAAVTQPLPSPVFLCVWVLNRGWGISAGCQRKLQLLAHGRRGRPSVGLGQPQARDKELPGSQVSAERGWG